MLRKYVQSDYGNTEFKFSEYIWTRLEAAPQYMPILKDYIMRLYRTSKKKCLDFVLNYAKALEKAFFALKNILQYDENDDLADHLERMFLLGRAANFYPLLIACWIRFKEENEKLRWILRLIETMIFRVYAIGRRRADTGRSRLYDLAHEVRKELIDYDELVSELRKLIHEYEWNWRFENHLKAGDFYES